MANFYQLVLESLVEGAGIPPEEAERHCALCIKWLRESGHAGTRIYIPAKPRKMTAAERAEAVRKLQGKMPISEIAELFEMSEGHVYRAFRREI